MFQIKLMQKEICRHKAMKTQEKCQVQKNKTNTYLNNATLPCLVLTTVLKTSQPKIITLGRIETRLHHLSNVR